MFKPKKSSESNTATVEIKPPDDINNNHKFTPTKSEEILTSVLSKLLKYGVLSATAVVLLGGILYLIDHGNEPVKYQVFQGITPELRSPTKIVNAAISGNSQGIIQIGLLLLVATPILRVIISFLTFLWQRELIYVIITGLVLVILIYENLWRG
jgi:uncharacterized membrane protein